MSTARCAACGHDRAARLFEKNGWPVHRCARCDLVFVWPLPTPAQLAELYCSGTYFKREGADGYGYVDYDRDHPLWGWVLDTLPPGGGRPLLDLGCAAGYFLDEARARGWAPIGVDIAASAVAAARGRGNAVAVGDVARGLPFADGAFPAVSMWDVIEHVTDLHAFLAESVRVLAPGGALLVNTPNVAALTALPDLARWSLMKPPEHLLYFHHDSLASALAQHGLAIERSWCLLGRVPGWPGRLIERVPGLRKLVRALVTRTFRGESLVVLARRA